MSNNKKGFKGSLSRVFVDDVNTSPESARQDTTKATNQSIKAEPEKVEQPKDSKKDRPAKKKLTNQEIAEIKPVSVTGKQKIENSIESENELETKFVKITVEVNPKFAELISREMFWERTTMKAIFDEELTNRYKNHKLEPIPANKKPTKRGPKPRK